MSTQNQSKLKKMLVRHKPGTVSLAKWLEGLGISRDLQKSYRRNGWLESIGPGAFRHPGEDVNWKGGLYAIQEEAGLPVHAGALTALSMQRMGHYVRLSGGKVFLFAPPATRVPRWFVAYRWGHPFEFIKTSVLPEGIGMTKLREKDYFVNISGPERAFMECLYLAPGKVDLVECMQIMEGLSGLRPDVAQELLEGCSSVKVKRLFLFMAGKMRHQWLDFVSLKKVDLGTGDRSIVKGGHYDGEFRIVIPEELLKI